MNKALLIAAMTGCLAVWTTNAAEEGEAKKPLTEEQKQIRKEMIEKYDANKDGKLDRDERAKMTPEDKEKMAKTGGVGTAGKGGAKKKAK